ncbi:hypothetical protein P879_09470, partial [Paragonimus westermani]
EDDLSKVADGLSISGVLLLRLGAISLGCKLLFLSWQELVPTSVLVDDDVKLVVNYFFSLAVTFLRNVLLDCSFTTYSVDSVEMERLPGYFVYTDLFDDTMYDHTMQLLMERKLDAQFQNELQEFCTAEEHKLYLKFLDEFHAYCRD